MVVILHATTPGVTPAPTAYLAVDLFFLLSGFVLAHAYGAKLEAGDRVWRDFMAQRFLRLWPLYVLGLLAGLAIHLYGVAKGWRADDASALALAFIPNALFLPTLLGLPSEPFSEFPFNPPAWSLFSEMAVNLAFAYLATSRLRWGVQAACALGALALLAIALQNNGLDVGGDIGLTQLGLARATFSFFLGVLLYRYRERLSRMAAMPAWLASLLLALVCLAPVRAAAFDLLAVMVVFPALVALSAHEEPRGGAATVCTLLGKASFPLYVIHWPLLAGAELAYLQLGAGPLQSSPAALMAAIALTLAAALALGYADDWLRLRTRGLLAKPRGATRLSAEAPT
jgi:peptidoglycan/LPS O-acetylase OafA/YrhL